MTVFEFSLLMAENAPEDLEVTTGAALAGLCVLAALLTSGAVWSKWRGRLARGEPILPVVQRGFPQIPLTLLGFGLLIAVMMSGMALFASLENAQGDPPAAADLVRGLINTVTFDIALIVMLGGPLVLLRTKRSAPPVSAAAESANIATLDALPDSDPSNPYAVPVEVVAEPPEDGETPVAAPEPWVLGQELRFAVEVCFAAWLPTALLRFVMVSLMDDDAQHPFLEMIMEGADPFVLLLIAFTAVVLAPIMEELLYRVIILGGLLCRLDPGRSSPALAIGLTSLLFAFAHGFPDSIALLPLAVAIAWTYHQRRSYRTVVLVHFLFNGFNIVIAGLGML